MRAFLLSDVTVDQPAYLREACATPMCRRVDRMSAAGGRSTQTTGTVMTAQTKQPVTQSSTDGGIYASSRLPVHRGFPSRHDFEIVTNAKGVAVAVTALRDFLRLGRVCRVSGQLLPYRSLHTRQLAPGIHVFAPLFCSLLNHSCDPNVFLDMSELWLWALKDIKKGDRLTMDLAMTEDKLQRQFACRCGSPGCRGWITGYDEMPNANGQLFFRKRRSPGPG